MRHTRRLHLAKLTVLRFTVIVADLWLYTQGGHMQPAKLHDNAIGGRFDIGGRALFLECWGQGPLTVVVERGTGGASTNDPSWLPIRDALVTRVRFCLYDRANLGQSDPDP